MRIKEKHFKMKEKSYKEQRKQLKSGWKNWENEDSKRENVTTAEKIKMKKKWIWNEQWK